MTMICTKLDILVHETYSEPKIEPPKQKKRRSKWKFPWRINMLAMPKMPRRKYEHPALRVRKAPPPLDEEVDFRSDQLHRPPIRTLTVNKEMFKFKGDKFVKVMQKRIALTWDTIYNFYAKQLRDKKLKRLRHKRELKRLKREHTPKKVLEERDHERKERILRIATPKKLFKPAEIIRQKQMLEEIMGHVDGLAEPTKHPLPPPKDYTKISKGALQYEITEEILKLTKEPEWRKNWIDNTLPLGVVNPAAKRAKCTPRLEELAKPSLGRREAKKQEDDKFDPWVISANALKYKPTARILELAKPLERD